MQLIEEYRALHRQRAYPGTTIVPHAGLIEKLIRRTGARTILDYGCGAGTQYTKLKIHRNWRVRMTLYDPAAKRWAAKPAGQFDGVLCTDVLEHVPEDEIDGVAADLAGYARLWCFATVCCRPAKKTFADGRNVHVTQRPLDWWRQRLAPAFAGGADLHLLETP